MLKTISVVFVAFILYACSNTPPDNHLVKQNIDLILHHQDVRDVAPESRVVGTAHAFIVKKIRTSTENDLLKVQVEVLNNRGLSDLLYYRAQWLNQAGIMQGQYEPWQTERFEGGQISIISLIAPQAQIKDFRFEIKPQY